MPPAVAPSSSSSSSSYGHGQRNRELFKDASFLDATDDRDSAADNHTPLLELHRSNVLRMETDELLKECRLDLDTVAWGSYAMSYLQQVEGLLTNTNSSNNSLAATTKKKNKKRKPLKCLVDPKDTPFAKLADKTANTEASGQQLPLLSFETMGIATGSTPTSGVLGLAKSGGNANQPPILSCGLVVPNDYWSGKDYLHHRYVDVSVQLYGQRIR